jgi:maltooligosyltrehalose trehalohydrolase
MIDPVSRELGRLISKGRRNFEHFSAFRDPDTREQIPDPQAESTFLNSKLKWDEVSSGHHSVTLRLHQDFIRFRQTKLVDRRRGTWKADLVGAETLALRYSPTAGTEVLLLVRLAANKTTLQTEAPILRLNDGQCWEFALSSNELM